jgi:hypothetical protein
MPQDYIFNNPPPPNQFDFIQSLLALAGEADPNTKSAILSAVGRYANIGQKPILQQQKIAADLERLTQNLAAKANSQGASLADKQAARQAALNLAIAKGDIQQALLQIKGAQAENMAQAKSAGRVAEIGAKGEQDWMRREQMGEQAMNMARYKALTAQELLKLKQDLALEGKKANYQFEVQQAADRAARHKALYDRGVQVAWNGPNDPEFTSIVTSLDAGDDNAKAMAGDLRRRAERVVNTKVANTIKYNVKKASALGVKLDPDQIREEIKLKGTAQPYVDKLLQTAAEGVAQQAKDAAHTAKAAAAGQQLGLTGAKLDAFVQRAGGILKMEPDALLAREIQSVRAGRARTMKWGGLGAAAVLAYLGSKFLGSKQESGSIDPQLQMALLQQMAGARGSGEDSAITQGRELTNLAKAMNILKLMGQFQGMQQSGPVDVARLM